MLSLKMIRLRVLSKNNILPVAISIVLVMSLIFLVFAGNFDINEGWYGNDMFLIAQGESPYLSFYYHRLPFFIEIYSYIANIFGMNIYSIRLISFFFTISFVSLTYFFVRKNDSRFLALLTILIYLSIFSSLKTYVTMQTYALTALMLQSILVVLALKNINEYLRLSLLVVVVSCIQWMRYPVDYLSIALLCYLVVYHRKDTSKLLFSIVLYLVINILLFYYYKSDNFIFSVFSGMVQDNPITLKSYLLYKINWFTFPATNYTLLLIVGGTLTGAVLVKYKYQAIIKHILSIKWLFMALLLIFGNAIMYILAPDGHPVQMLYVIPILICVYAHVTHKLFNVKKIPTILFIFLPVFVVSTLSAERDFKFQIKNSEINQYNNLGKIVNTLTDENDEILAFNPIYGLVSNRRITKGFEFDLYGIKSKLNTNLVRKYGLNNKENIMLSISNRVPRLIILDSRFYSVEGMGQKLLGMREDIIAAVSQNYNQIDYENKSSVNEILGEVNIYVRD